MTTQNRINSKFYQIANVDAVGDVKDLGLPGNLIAGGNIFSTSPAATFSANTVSANYLVATVSNLGNVANLTLLGGNANQLLRSLGANGAVEWADVQSTPGGTNTQVQFNDDGVFAGNTALTFDKVTGTLSATTFSGSGSGLTGIPGGSISGGVGFASTADQANNSNFAGTVTGAAQANITSLGTLTGLTVVGISDLGDAGNVKITGGAANQFLKTDGTGNLSWETLSSSSISNGTSNVTIAAVNGNVLTYVNGFERLRVHAGGANVSGNLQSGNLNTGLIAATYIESAGQLSAGTQIISLEPTLPPLIVSSTATVANLSVAHATVAGSANGVSGANVSGEVAFAAVANAVAGANVVGTVANATHALTANTVVDSAQPNITSVGTLVSLAVGGAVSANSISSVANNLTLTSAVGNITLNANGGVIDAVNHRIVNLLAPNAASDAATKAYVDSVAEGLHVHESADAATPDTLANITGGTITYNNGSSGVGANLVTTGTYTLIDNVNIATVGTRILVKNEANTAHNGIYVYTDSTTITRATDFNTPTEMAGGDFLFCTGGTLYNSTGWVMVDAVATVGTDPVIFSQFSGAGTYTAGVGLLLNGSEFSIANTAVTAASYGNGDSVATFTVNERGQLTAASNVAITANAANLTGTTLASGVVTSSLTTVGTLGNLSVGGNILAQNITANANVNADAVIANTISGNGSGITAISGGAITGAVPFATTANSVSGANVSGAVAFATTANSVAGANVSGEVQFANTANAVAGANVSGTVANATHALTANTVTTAAQPNITSVGTLSSLTVGGTSNLGAVGNVTITGGGANQFLKTDGAGLLSWASPVVVQGAIEFSAPTDANNQVFTNIGIGSFVSNSFAQVFYNGVLMDVGEYEISGTNLTVNRFLRTGDDITVGPTGTAGAVSFDPTQIYSGTSNVKADSSVRISAGGVANVATFTNTGTTITQPTQFSSNVSVPNLSATNQLSAVFLSGQVVTPAQPLITEVGVLTSLDVSATIFAGNVYANSGTVGASLLTGTLTTDTQPNITSVGSLTSLSVVGNANVGNLGTAGLITATGNVSGGNLTTVGVLSVTGNANVGNIGSNIAIFTGNVTAPNFMGSLANTNSNVSIPAAGGNVNTAVNGTVRFIVTNFGSNTAGSHTVSGTLTAARIVATDVFAGGSGTNYTLDWNRSVQTFSPTNAMNITVNAPPLSGMTTVLILQMPSNSYTVAVNGLTASQMSGGVTSFSPGTQKACHLIFRSTGTTTASVFCQVDSTN